MHVINRMALWPFTSLTVNVLSVFLILFQSSNITGNVTAWLSLLLKMWWLTCHIIFMCYFAIFA